MGNEVLIGQFCPYSLQEFLLVFQFLLCFFNLFLYVHQTVQFHEHFLGTHHESHALRISKLPYQTGFHTGHFLQDGDAGEGRSLDEKLQVFLGADVALVADGTDAVHRLRHQVEILQDSRIIGFGLG